MAHGGKRPGAGRKTGTTNKRSAAEAQAVKASGKDLPHEWLLAVMHGEVEFNDYVVSRSGAVVADETGKPVVITRKPTLAERMDAAGKAAPFYAPKLQAVASVPSDAPNPIEELMRQVTEAATNRARPTRR